MGDRVWINDMTEANKGVDLGDEERICINDLGRVGMH